MVDLLSEAGSAYMPVMAEPIYLDANATERLRPEAREAVLRAMALEGNPASIHTAGRAARRVLEEARRSIAARFGAAPADLVFTSGGTEANALAIANLGAGRRVITGATEHDAVRQAAPGSEVLAVDSDGYADLGALEELLRGRAPALVCLMLANNETGAIQPVAKVARLCATSGAILHVDAVQAAGRLEFTVAELGAASVAISGHKVGGPKGAGALVLAPGRHITPQIAGGGQESGRRGGTQALPAIAGFAAALEAARDAGRLGGLRDRAEAAAVGAGAMVCGGAIRLPNTTCLALPGRRADMQVIALDLAGVAVSAGAACSSGKVAASHVLQAMGLGTLADCAIRVSLPWNCTEADIDGFVHHYTVLAGSPARLRVASAAA